MTTRSNRPLTGQHNQCSGCGEHFNSNAAFDMHRIGSHTDHERRCLTVREMKGRGMALNKTGWWVTSLRENDDA